MKTKQELQQITANGFTWSYNEAGAHFFSKSLDTTKGNRFAVIRCLPEDLVNGNFEYFAEHGLTNTNKVEPLDHLNALVSSGVEYPEAVWKTSQEFQLSSSEVNDLESDYLSQ